MPGSDRGSATRLDEKTENRFPRRPNLNLGKLWEFQAAEKAPRMQGRARTVSGLRVKKIC
jgi:hypothetical protein